MPVQLLTICLLSFVHILFVMPALGAPTGDCFTSETVNAEKQRDGMERETDNKKLTVWAKRAVAANHAAVIHRIGREFLEERNFEKAYIWFDKGVPLGDYQAMHDLGVMWLNGEGRERDLSKAYAWFLLAGEYIPTNWDDYFFPPSKIQWQKSIAKNLSKQMTEEQIHAGREYFEQQKKLIRCSWYEWYGHYIATSKKSP